MAVSDGQMLVLTMLHASGWSDVAKDVEASGGSIVHVEIRHWPACAERREVRSDLWRVFAGERRDGPPRVALLSALRTSTGTERGRELSTVEWNFVGDMGFED